MFVSLSETMKDFSLYNQWANARLYDAVAQLTDDDYKKDMGSFFSSIHQTLNHILVADRVWMHRMSGVGETYAQLNSVLADSLINLRELRSAEDRCIIDFVFSLLPESYESKISYTNSKGEVFCQTYAEILPHFYNHQTHHRAQVHTMLTQCGKGSVVLDFIQFLRERDAALIIECG